MFKPLRIGALLLVLLAVALGAWSDRTRATGWRGSLRVAVYPIAADDSPVARDYIATLSGESYDDIQRWFEGQAQRLGLDKSQPVSVSLAPRVEVMPPEPPRGGHALEIAAWSLRLRYWAWRHGQGHQPRPQVKLFVIFHDPAKSMSVPHSLGLEKGMIGVVHAFASRAQAAQNNIVIAHELLHTLGATDKYELASNLPRHPDGYAEPQRQPLWPQTRAEIMAGRVPLSATEARMPDSVLDTVIGAVTASEIGLVAPAR